MSVHQLRPNESFADWLLEELNRAYLEARKAKRSTFDEHLFEVNALENIVNLRDSIINRNFHPSSGIAFVTRKPVIREIFAAPFRDRVVHQLLFNIVADWWDNRLSYDCYSCRVGKGTWFGIERAVKHMRRASENYTKETYVIKLDIQGYFMSLPRQKLFERVLWGLDRQFPEGGIIYRTARYLWREIIFDEPIVGVHKRGTRQDWRDLPKNKSLFCQPPGHGIVIGNLSSQLLSNIYLDRLDRYVTQTLGYKHYGRYVDDFYIIVPEEQYEQAKLDIQKIESFLFNELDLVLHPNKRYCQNIKKGMAFLGVVIYPRHVVPGGRIQKNFYDAAERFANGETEVESVVSYMGLVKNCRGKSLTKNVFGSVGWEYR